LVVSCFDNLCTPVIDIDALRDGGIRIIFLTTVIELDLNTIIRGTVTVARRCLTSSMPGGYDELMMNK
jgi:hypothetical protein